MTKHLIPQNDILPHITSKDCDCNPVLSTALVRHETIFFYNHHSWDLMDMCEKVGIKTNETWKLEVEMEDINE